MFESPLEEAIFHALTTRCRGVSVIHPQHVCKTRFADFRLDFMLEAGRFRAGIEVDGKPYHEATRDALRDAAILEAGHVACIVRLRGQDVHWHIHETMYLLSLCVPEIFADQQIRNLAVLSQDFVAAEPFPSGPTMWCLPVEISERAPPDHIYVIQRSNDHHTKRMIEFIKASKAKTFARLLTDWNNG